MRIIAPYSGQSRKFCRRRQVTYSRRHALCLMYRSSGEQATFEVWFICRGKCVTRYDVAKNRGKKNTATAPKGVFCFPRRDNPCRRIPTQSRDLVIVIINAIRKLLAQNGATECPCFSMRPPSLLSNSSMGIEHVKISTWRSRTFLYVYTCIWTHLLSDEGLLFIFSLPARAVAIWKMTFLVPSCVSCSRELCDARDKKDQETNGKSPRVGRKKEREITKNNATPRNYFWDDKIAQLLLEISSDNFMFWCEKNK